MSDALSTIYIEPEFRYSGPDGRYLPTVLFYSSGVLFVLWTTVHIYGSTIMSRLIVSIFLPLLLFVGLLPVCWISVRAGGEGLRVRCGKDKPVEVLFSSITRIEEKAGAQSAIPFSIVQSSHLLLMTREGTTIDFSLPNKKQRELLDYLRQRGFKVEEGPTPPAS